MAFQPCTNTAEVAVKGVMGSRDLDVTNVFHVHWTNTGLDQGNADFLAATFANIYDDIKAYLAVDVQFNEVVCTDLRTEGADQHVSTSGFPVVGTSVAESIADFCAIKGHLFGARRDRANRGRFFITGLTVDAANGNDVAAGAATALLEGMQDVLDALVAGGLYWGILSRYKDKAKRASGVLNQVTAISVDPVLSTLRGRRVGG